MTLGELIQSSRKKAGLTQVELGKMLGVSGSMIGQWESNLRNPKSETIGKIASVLGKPFMDVFQIYMEETNAAITDKLNSLKAEAEIITLKTMEESEKEFQKEVKSFIDSTNGRTIIAIYMYELNADGKAEAVKRVEELAEIPRYQKASDDQGSNKMQVAAHGGGVTLVDAPDPSKKQKIERLTKEALDESFDEDEEF